MTNVNYTLSSSMLARGFILEKNVENGGFDLRADIDEPITLHMLDRALIPTGLLLAPEELGIHSDVRPTSGLPNKHGVMPVLGLIDWGYRGELKINLINLSREKFTINPGDKIAQVVFFREEQINPCFISQGKFKEMSTERGKKGFGGQSGVV